MSRFRIAMTIAVLASLSASPALARGFGLGTVIGGMRAVLGRVLPHGGHRGHHLARESHSQEGRVQTAALEPQAMPDGRLGSPVARGQIVATAALAGWHDGRASSGWWRHNDGGYGWTRHRRRKASAGFDGGRNPDDRGFSSNQRFES